MKEDCWAHPPKSGFPSQEATPWKRYNGFCADRTAVSPCALGPQQRGSFSSSSEDNGTTAPSPNQEANGWDVGAFLAPHCKGSNALLLMVWTIDRNGGRGWFRHLHQKPCSRGPPQTVSISNDPPPKTDCGPIEIKVLQCMVIFEVL